MNKELRICEMAFRSRASDAMDRATRLRVRYENEAADARRTADLLLGCVEHWHKEIADGVYWHFRSDDCWADPVEEAGKWLERFVEAELLLSAALDRVRKVEALIAKYGRRRLNEDGATTEMLMQIRKSRAGDPVLRLVALEHLTADDLNDAREIAGIVRHVVSRLDAKTTYMPTASEVGDSETRRRSAADTAEWYALLHNFVYLPWADEVRADLPLIFGLVVDGVPLERLRKRHGMRWGTALKKVQGALASYRKFRRRYLRDGAEANRRAPRPGDVNPLERMPEA